MAVRQRHAKSHGKQRHQQGQPAGVRPVLAPAPPKPAQAAPVRAEDTPTRYGYVARDLRTSALIWGILFIVLFVAYFLLK